MDVNWCVSVGYSVDFLHVFFFDCLTNVCTIESGVSQLEHKFTLLEWERPVKITMLWMRRCV